MKIHLLVTKEKIVVPIKELKIKIVRMLEMRIIRIKQ